MNFIDFQLKFSSEKAIIKHFCYIRYGTEPACNHCGSLKVYQRPDRPKVFQCGDCTNDFSVFKNTIFENSSTNLIKWFYAIHLFLNGRKGISGLQLQREIDVTYKTAWRMLRQIRLAMGNKELKQTFETIVEIDETYVGGKPRKGKNGMLDTNQKSKRGRGSSKTPVIGVIDRDTKQVHAKVALPNKKGQKLTGRQLLSVLNEVSKKGITVVSDEFRSYNILTKSGFVHLKVDHSKEFTKDGFHTNNIESFWSMLKRGIYGIYHSVSVKHMQHYIDEFCFRHNHRQSISMFDDLLKQGIFH